MTIETDLTQSVIKSSSLGRGIDESYATLRTNILLSSKTKSVQILLLASNENVSAQVNVSINLALTYSNTVQNVILLDGDLRSRTLSKVLDKENASGITEYLFRLREQGEDISPDAFLDENLLQTSYPNIKLLPAGKPMENFTAYSDLLNLGSLISSCRERSSLLIICSPTLINSSDAAILSTYADATLLMITKGKTTVKHTREALNLLSLAHANVIGTILVNS